MTIKNYTNKSKKLIIYCSVPVFDTWPKKWKLVEFKNYGFDVEIWSTEEIFFKQENIKAAASGSKTYRYTELEVIKIKNLLNLEKKIAELDAKSIVCIMTLGSRNNKFYNSDLEIFNKYKIKYVIHHLIPYPYIPDLWSKLKVNLKFLKIRMNNNKKNPSLIIGTGSEGRKQVSKIYKKNLIYKSLPSYNVLWDKEKPIITKKYVVYVEDEISLSPDAALFGMINPNHDIKGTYERINDVFEKIENWTNSKVVIAASGKYDYTVNPFKNRQIIYKKTPNLVQHSELVLGHKSSGLDQAIVDHKPILIFKDVGFTNEKNKQINKFARVYGINSIWTGELTKTNFEKNNYVNLVRNKEIINKYLKEDIIKGSFFENLVSSLHEI